MRLSIVLCGLVLLFMAGCEESGSSATGSDSVSGKGNEQVEAAPDLNVRMEALCEELFTDYKKIPMDPMDRMPRFKLASQSFYRMFRRSSPIAVELNPAVYPRVKVSAFQFSREDMAVGEVEKWLNKYEHSGEDIVLGAEVSAFKSPPLFCALIGKTFVMLHTSCLYQHPTYDALRDGFFAEVDSWVRPDGPALTSWEVKCGGGEFSYNRRAYHSN